MGQDLNNVYYDINMIMAVVGGYAITAIFWFTSGIAHLKWGNKYFAMGDLGLGFWVLGQAYKNYDFFIIKLHDIDPEGFMNNVYTTTFFLVCVIYRTIPYFKHAKNYIRRTLKSKITIEKYGK